MTEIGEKGINVSVHTYLIDHVDNAQISFLVDSVHALPWLELFMHALT
jgi:hypothetical protein